MIGSRHQAGSAGQALDPGPAVARSRPATASGDLVSSAGNQFRQRLWLVICCLSLLVLAFLTRPGNIIADTKIDLAINPAGFLSRALQLWDPAQFGQLQDQAVGYFFPIGPFFVLGKLMALPPWVIQRCWLGALLLAAFLGATRLTSRLGIGTPGTQLAAGFAYALAPRALSLLGVLSGEFLPAAMLPWILIPLVRAVREDSGLGAWGRIRAVAQSGIAVALCSGVNAASVIAMLLPAGIFLLTAPRPARRWRILALWVPGVLLATWWWLHALLLLGRYGASPLTYTESAMTTTSVTSLSNAFRGTEDWVTYLVVNGRPWWPVGFAISTGALATIMTGLVAGLGVTGLLRRALPYRRFLLCSLLVGVAIVVTGHVGGLGNPLAGQLDHFLNGPLAPLRNLRKFDPMIRLPIAVGLAHVLATARLPGARTAVRYASAVALVAIAAPAYIGGLSQAGDFPAVPQYWTQASDWLNTHAGHQAVLAVPGARFGEYTWGRPIDDVLEASFTGDWASRQLTYIGSVGVTRLLDAIDQRMAAGDGSAGLTQVLARMGIKYIVVRNDLLRSDLRGARPARIHDALSQSPGIVRVAAFGGLSAGSRIPDDAAAGFDAPYPPVEIYQVARSQPVVSEVPTAHTLRVYGGPEALLTLADAGLLKGRPVLLNADSPHLPAARSVVTDSLRRRIRNFGEIRADYSPTLTATDPARTFEAAADYLDPGWQRDLSTAQYGGIANVTASSSDADIDAIPTQSGTGRLPFAAVDGDLRTMWESGGLTGPVGQWIKIEFQHAIDPGLIHVAFVRNRDIGPPPTEVVISTARGRLTEHVRTRGGFQSLRVPAGLTTWLKLTVVGTKRGALPGRQVGISEISIPGIGATRSIVAPQVRTSRGDPSTVVLAKAEPQPTGCMLTSVRWVCSGSLIRPTEEQYGFNHSFVAAATARATLTGSAVLIDPALVDRYAFLGPQPQVSASSALLPDPQDQPASAFDGSRATTWIASLSDRHPVLKIGWRTPRIISKVTIFRPSATAGPLQVLVSGSGGQVRGGFVLGHVSHLTIRPMRTRSLRFYFTPTALPLEISDISIPGVPHLSSPAQAPFRLPCGFGPRVLVNGVPKPTKVRGTLGDLLDERPVSFAVCSPVTVRAGLNTVIEPGWEAFDLQTAVLDRSGRAGLAGSPASTPSPVRVIKWTPSARQVWVDARQQEYLIIDQNFNSGWQAAIAGRKLTGVRLDGWKQAYLVPAGAHGVVTISYGPEASYRRNLFGGLAALGLLLLVAVVPLRRRRRAAMPLAQSRSLIPARRLGTGEDWPAAVPAPQRPIPRAGIWPRLLPIPALALAGIFLLSAAGIWIGGSLGAVILPLAILVFAGALILQGSSVICRELARPWLAGGLLLISAALAVVGAQLSHNGASEGVAGVLTSIAPQVLCIIVIARLVAALIIPMEPAELRGDSRPAPRHADPVGRSRRHKRRDG
jgi:arabinofuranan 3-O-arabinosyltransferase